MYEDIHAYITKYNQLPTKEALLVTLGQRETISEDDYTEAKETVEALFASEEHTELLWLLEHTESWCRDRSIHNAILKSIHIIDGTDQVNTKGAIPKLLEDALAVSFDPSIGLDLLEDAGKWYEMYHRTEEKLPFDLALLNKITRGGLAKKSLTIVMGGVNCGKSLVLCHMAAAALNLNKNVLYITLEMAEERIAERVYSNVLDVDISNLEGLDRASFDRKVARLTETIKGKLIIREFPTASAGAHHFKALLNELALKKHFRPDVIFVDYINLCCSSRIRLGQSVNSYTYIKSIAEELRGLAVEFNLPLVSATQFTRSGFTSSDPGLEDTAESFGLPATADLTLAIIRSDEMDQLRQIQFKQLKNRYNDVSQDRRFVVGINYGKMRLFDIEAKQQEGLTQANQTKEPTPENVVSTTMGAMIKEARQRDVTRGWTI